MTKRTEPVKSEPIHNVQQDDSMEEDLPGLRALAESLSIFSVDSSSQIQSQVRVESLGSLVDLPLAQVSVYRNAIGWVTDFSS